MTRLAITGHRGLPTETTKLVDTALREEVRRHGLVVGVSALADGADSLFARAVLDHGGLLVAIVPARKYRDELPAEHHPEYDALLNAASSVIPLDHEESSQQAHMDASLTMLDRTDALVAVWDGQPARGYGGTADVVEAARDRELPVTVIWPEGAERD